MKIAFFDTKPFEKEYLETNLDKNFERIYSNLSLNDTLPLEENFKNADVISVFVNSDLSRKVLEKFPNLKYIVLRSVGYSHVDLLFAKEKGIKVFNAPHYGDSSIAEYVFALLFSIVRNITGANLAVKNQSTNKFLFKGMELAGKTIGIVGLGAIGKEVYNIAHAFRLNPIYYDIKETEGYNRVSLEELCQKADIISINCPLTCETLHLFDTNKFLLMKNGVIIINTARGEIIKTRDLYNALLSGRVGFAALDVVECEHDLYDFRDCDEIKESCYKAAYFTNKLLAMENVLITPHVAYNTYEAQKRILDITIENITTLGKFTNEPKNLVLI